MMSPIEREGARVALAVRFPELVTLARALQTKKFGDHTKDRRALIDATFRLLPRVVWEIPHGLSLSLDRVAVCREQAWRSHSPCVQTAPETTMWCACALLENAETHLVKDLVRIFGDPVVAEARRGVA